MPKRKRNKEDGTKKDVKYKGVYKRGERFAANIRTDGSKIQYLGTYDTAKEAAEVYDLAAIQAGRPTSKLNFLDQVPKKYKPKNNGLSSTNTTGFTGVSKRGNRFQALIYIGGKQQNIGRFGTAKEAAEAYDQAALQAKFPRSQLNFSDTPKEEVSRIKKRRIGNYKNKTGFNGVCKKGKKFRAQICFDGEKKILGTFTKARDAAMAYDEAIVANQLPYKKLNFPCGDPEEKEEEEEQEEREEKKTTVKVVDSDSEPEVDVTVPKVEYPEEIKIEPEVEM